MNYDFIAIPDQDVPQASDPLFQHLVTTYASETNKTASMWRAIPDDLLDFKPHEKVNTIRAILVHQILSERRFFAQFVGIQEPPVEDLLPPGDHPAVQAYLDRYIALATGRLPQLAEATAEWWLTEVPSFGGVRLTNPILQGLVAFPGGKVRLPGDANEDSHRETKRSGQGTILAAYDRRPCPLRPIRPSLLST